MKPIVKHNGKELFLDVDKYSVNGRMYIGLVTKEGELWNDLTINLPDVPLEENTIFVNADLSNELREKLIDTGVFFDLFSPKKYNMGSYETYYVSQELMKEYTNDTFYIQVWGTELDRENGFSVRDDSIFDNLDSAIEYAREEFEKYKYASLEIVDSNNKVYFCKDKESEDIYINGQKICFIDEKLLGEYIKCWEEHKDLPINDRLLYTKEGDKYVAIDNVGDNCWVEDFNNEKDALNWLLGIENEEKWEEDLIK